METWQQLCHGDFQRNLVFSENVPGDIGWVPPPNKNPGYAVVGGCPFNGPLSGTKYPTRAASPIKYNADQEPVKLKRLEP